MLVVILSKRKISQNILKLQIFFQKIIIIRYFLCFFGLYTGSKSRFTTGMGKKNGVPLYSYLC